MLTLCCLILHCTSQSFHFPLEPFLKWFVPDLFSLIKIILELVSWMPFSNDHEETQAIRVAQQYRICLQYRRLGFNPWVGMIPWRRKWQPTLVFLPGIIPWTRGWWSTVHGVSKESDMTQQLNKTKNETQCSSWMFYR